MREELKTCYFCGNPYGDNHTCPGSGVSEIQKVLIKNAELERTISGLRNDINVTALANRASSLQHIENLKECERLRNEVVELQLQRDTFYANWQRREKEAWVQRDLLRQWLGLRWWIAEDEDNQLPPLLIERTREALQ